MKIRTILTYRFSGSHVDTHLVITDKGNGRKCLRILDSGTEIGAYALFDAVVIGKISKVEYEKVKKQWKLINQNL